MAGVSAEEVAEKSASDPESTAAAAEALRRHGRHMYVVLESRVWGLVLNESRSQLSF